MADRNCTADGCDRNARSGKAQYCNTHYSRMWRNGTLELFTTAAPNCSIDGCDRKHRRNGYCSMHDVRVKVHGDPNVNMRTGENHFRWAGDEVGYHGVHSRLKKERGPASAHNCVDCDDQAAHWSYDNTEVDERMWNDLRYSPDITQYSPRCKSCHKRFDMRERSA